MRNWLFTLLFLSVFFASFCFYQAGLAKGHEGLSKQIYLSPLLPELLNYKKIRRIEGDEESDQECFCLSESK